MIQRQKEQLSNVQNVAVSSVATVTIPVGRRLLELIIEHGHAGTNTIAATMTNISDIEFLIDDKVQRKLTGTELRRPAHVSGALRCGWKSVKDPAG